MIAQSNRIIRVFCLDNEKNYYYKANSGKAALDKMLYTLNLRHKVEGEITETKNCFVLSASNDRTYAVLKKEACL